MFEFQYISESTQYKISIIPNDITSCCADNTVLCYLHILPWINNKGNHP